MRLSIAALALGMTAALALGACTSGGRDSDNDRDREEESSRDTRDDEDNASEEETAERRRTEPGDPSDYFEDRTGRMDSEIGDNAGERLAAFDADSGHDVHIVAVVSVDGDISAEADRMFDQRGIDADGALILISAMDESISIVAGSEISGRLDDRFRTETIETMIERFDAGDFGGGINGAIDAIVDELDR